MPPTPFFATCTPPGQMTTLDTSEKISVTDVTDDTLTIVRAQGDTTAKAIGVDWIISNSIYTDDVVAGPASAVSDDIAVFDGTTGKIIKDGGKKIADLPFYSSGVFTAPTLTDSGTGSVTIGSGDYVLSTVAAGSGFKNKYTITGNTFALTDLTMNYIVANYNGGTPVIQSITDVTLINETTIIPIFSIFRNGNYLHVQNWDNLANSLANKVHQSIVKTQRYRRQEGLTLSEYGTRNVGISNGVVWVGAVPVTLATIATATDNMFFWYHSGGNWTSSLVTQYNNSQYDNGTNLVSLNPAKYAVNWVFRGIEDQKHTYIVVGGGNYTLAQAEASTMPVLPPAISSHTMLVGRIIVLNGDTTATLVQSAFVETFTSASANVHGDLTGRDSADQHPASSITNTPAGNIAATTVQAAINELDTEKQAVMTKATGTDVDTGTDDTKYLTVKSINDSHNVPMVAPSTSGKVMTSNGTDWISSDLPTLAAMTTDALLSGTVNGTNIVFTTAANFTSIQVYKNGVAMHLGDDFTITGANQITFVTAPSTGTKLTATYINSTSAMIQGSNSWVTQEIPSQSVEGGTSAKLLTLSNAYIPGTTSLYINGIRQIRDVHYTEHTATQLKIVVEDVISGANYIVSYQFVQSVSGNADTLDSYHANATPTASNIPVLDSNAKLPVVATPELGSCAYFGYLSSNQTTTSTTPVAITGMSANITTNGRALLLTITVSLGVSGQTTTAGLYINGLFYQAIVSNQSANLPHTGQIIIPAGTVPAGTYAVTPRFFSQSSGVTSTVYAYSTVSFSVVEL